MNKNYEAFITEIQQACQPETLIGIYVSLNDASGLTSNQKRQIKEKIEEKVPTVKADFESWEKAYNRVTYWPYTSLKKAMAPRMTEAAKNFHHWRILYKRCASFGEYKDHIYHGMMASASNPDQLLFAYNLFASEPDFQSKIMESVLACANTFEEWIKIYCCSPLESILREKLIELFAEMHVTLKQLWKAYRSSSCKKKKAVNIIISRLRQINEGTFDEWCSIYISVPRSCQLKIVALQKMRERMPV